MYVRQESAGAALLFISLLAVGTTYMASSSSGKDVNQDGLDRGRELFTREWLPNDKRSFAGDGLGPVHNARSCVACHNQGGVGGAGGRGANSIIVSAFVSIENRNRTLFGTPPVDDPNPKAPHQQPDRTKLAAIHPALRTGSSFVLHRHGIGNEFDRWYSRFAKLPEQSPNFPETVPIDNVSISLIPSERNPPALFGIALIDGIPDQVLEAIALEQARTAGPAEPPVSYQSTNRTYSIPVSGRVLHLKDGRVGRFGWKNSVATAREFSLLACATEIGLEVPGFHRAPPPWIKNYSAPGLDLNTKQADDLTHFVTSLPRPETRQTHSATRVSELAAGNKLFTKIGCANCHRPKLGEVEGLYSDLLLHDMGQSLSGAGSYHTTLEAAPTKDSKNPLAILGNFVISKSNEVLPKFGAGAREWRTPPLWGVHDTGPYLHDGRAPTIEDAIKRHDGEGLIASQEFTKLTPAERAQLCTFLESLVAPARDR